MIAKTYISKNLTTLDGLYRGSSSVHEGLLYSKLAIIEICGWIEMSMDDLVLRCVTRNLKLEKNRANIREQTVQKTYGFEYDRHFRKMLIQVVGLMNVERIEHRIDQTKMAQFKTALGALKMSRDSLAHTYLKGTAFSIDAPSVTKSRFSALFNGMDEFERVMRKLRL